MRGKPVSPWMNFYKHECFFKHGTFSFGNCCLGLTSRVGEPAFDVYLEGFLEDFI